MERVRRRVGDAKLERLVLAFLKAGVLSEEQFLRSDSGTPQGGILSPLLANIALSISLASSCARTRAVRRFGFPTQLVGGADDLLWNGTLVLRRA